MKKIILLLCCALMTEIAFSQKKVASKTKPKTTVTTAASADPELIATYLAEYKFDQAATLVQKQIAADKKKKLSTEQSEEMLQTCRTGMNMLRATEKIVFIDSMVVDRHSFLKSYHLGKEAGFIDTYNHFFNKTDTTWQMQNATVYRNELGDRVCFPFPDERGLAKIHAKYKTNDAWGETLPLPGLDQNNDIQGFPFIMSDGITLYYSAQSDESFGGYDIFVTRYNSDTKQFLKPENIGMPFNSPANDYLYAIDELNELGWFVSDRYQPADKVCIYIFIPTIQREIYDYSATGIEKLTKMARINSIAETWVDREMVSAAQTRLNKVRNSQNEGTSKEVDVWFVINDQTVYTSYTQFKNSRARGIAKEIAQKEEQLSRDELALEKLRGDYAGATTQRKAQITPDILSKEVAVEALRKIIGEQKKEMRRLEIGNQ